jgi:flagellar biosynthesis/type III secretory pathway chaperone
MEIKSYKMKITKKQLRRIIKEEKARLLSEQVNDVDQIIAQGRAFFDRVIELSQAQEDDPNAAAALEQIEAALSDEVKEKSYGYVKFTIL